jgi:hypothetical protein
MESDLVKPIFILGIGRSGTTLLGRLVALSPTPMRFISEPITCLKEPISPDRVDVNFISPAEQERVAKIRGILLRMEKEVEMFKSQMLARIERDDPVGRYLLIKEVHALLAFPQILKDLDCRVAVITRDTSRVLDSYLLVEGNFKYLVEEYKFLKEYVAGRIAQRSPVIDAALEKVSPAVVRYLRRPTWITSRLRRTACTMEVIRHFLLAWAEQDDRVVAVQYKDVCLEPVSEMQRVLAFLGLACDARAESQILKMTSGESTEYYATDKDSRKVLTQAYRKLMPREARWIGSLVADRRY